MTAGLSGRLAVVTGAASGIGAACAQVLAEHGARVVSVDLNGSGAEAVAAALPGRGHGALTLDVADAAAIEAAAQAIETDHGPADILVTSAGVIQKPVPPEEIDLETLDRIVAVDQRGVYLCCLAFGGRMARRGSGAIVNIASIAGMRSMPLHAYSPAKAAVISMTETLAAEWGRSGVRVNAVCPGYTLTPALQAEIDAGRRDPANLERDTALGRMVMPREIADAVAFLASDSARAVTGISLPVDAGWLATVSWTTYGGARPPRGN